MIRAASPTPGPDDAARAGERLRSLMRGGEWSIDAVRKALRFENGEEMSRALRGEASMLTLERAEAIERMANGKVQPGERAVGAGSRSRKPGPGTGRRRASVGGAIRADFRELLKTLRGYGWSLERASAELGLNGLSDLETRLAQEGHLDVDLYDRLRRLVDDVVRGTYAAGKPEPTSTRSQRTPTGARMSGSKRTRKPPKAGAARRRWPATATPDQHERARAVLRELSARGTTRQQVAEAIGYAHAGSLMTVMNRGRLPAERYEQLIKLAGDRDSPPAAEPPDTADGQSARAAEVLPVAVAEVRQGGPVTRFDMETALGGAHSGDDYVAAAAQALRLGIRILDEGMRKGKFPRLLARGLEATARDLIDQVESLEEWVTRRDEARP
jgi:hypothetical protein